MKDEACGSPPNRRRWLRVKRGVMLPSFNPEPTATVKRQQFAVFFKDSSLAPGDQGDFIDPRLEGSASPKGNDIAHSSALTSSKWPRPLNQGVFECVATVHCTRMKCGTWFAQCCASVAVEAATG